MTLRERSKLRAFSLLESLVVMFIILLLASIVIPGLMGRSAEVPKLPEQKPREVQPPPVLPFPDEVPTPQAPEPVEEEASPEASAEAVAGD